MAFFRFNRDKRGYENFYLVQSTANRRGKVRQRILYWYRTPPGVRVGREPFDEDVRRALEAQNPDVTFDWRAILDTPIPSADADKWRERRRAERAAKHAMAAADADDEPADETPAREPEDASSDLGDGDAAEQPRTVVAVAVANQSTPESGVDPARKRRRRRRGKRPGVPAAPGAPDAPNSVAHLEGSRPNDGSRSDDDGGEGTEPSGD